MNLRAAADGQNLHVCASKMQAVQGQHASRHASSAHQGITCQPHSHPAGPHLSHRPSSFRNWLRTEATSAEKKPRCSSGTAAAAAAATAGVAPAPAAGGGTTPLRTAVRCGRGCCAGRGGTPCRPLPMRPAAGWQTSGTATLGRLWRRRRRRRRWCPHHPRRPLQPGSPLLMHHAIHLRAAPALRAGRCGATGARSGAAAASPSAGLHGCKDRMPVFASDVGSQGPCWQ